MYPSDIDDIFQSFQQLKALIVGDVMLDAYIWGKVERISPEAPVPVVNARKREVRLGGAANVALNIQALGATPLLCAVVGDDAYGAQFCDLLAQQQISTEGIVTSNTRVTTVKERILAGSQQMLRVDSEDDSLLSEAESTRLMQCIEQMLPQADVVVFQDYDKGVLSEDRIQQVVALAQKHHIPTAADPKKRNFLAYQQITLFKPNLKELKEGLKTQTLALMQPVSNGYSQEAIAEAAGYLKTHLQLTYVLITLSELGVYIHADEEHLIPAHVRQIADVSGAGDTVISIASLCLALRLTPRQLAQLANLGGGIVCEYAGVVPIDRLRLIEEAKKLSPKNV